MNATLNFFFLGQSSIGVANEKQNRLCGVTRKDSNTTDSNTTDKSA